MATSSLFLAISPTRGGGHDNPHQSPIVDGFPLRGSQRDDLIAFLRSLTDEALLQDPRFADPWTSVTPPH